VQGVGRTINARLKEAFPDFNVDNVTDLPRIMRLPGTINIPDERKRAQGRSPTPTMVLDDHSLGLGYSINQLKAEFPPTKAPQSSSSDKDLPKIDMAVVRAAGSHNELPTELREKFENAREHDPALQDVWNLNSFTGQKDTSRSGFVFALAGRLKRAGGFTATEFGQLLWVWERLGYTPDEIDARLIGRAWQNANPPIADPSGLKDNSGPSADKDDADEKPFASLATSFTFPDPATIEPPDWVLEDFALRGRVSTVTGAGAAGKSTLSLLVAVAYAAGREDVCGFRIQKPGTAWVWNQEDPMGTLDIRVSAVLQEYGISREDLLDENGKTRLLINSGVGREKRLTLVEKKDDVLHPTKHLDRVIKTALHEGADLIIFDPLISIHQASENANEEMRAVFDHLADAAYATKSAMVLMCHPGKPDKRSNEGFAGDAYAARGASSQPDAACVAATLTKMSEADQKKWRVPSGSSPLDLVRFEVPKINDAPVPPTRWYERKGVLVPRYRGRSVPVLKPIELEPAVTVAEDTAAKIAEAIRDNFGLNTLVSVSAIAQHLPSSLAASLVGKNRGRFLNQIFGAEKLETSVGGTGVLRRVMGRGALGTKLILSDDGLTDHPDQPFN
jgi:AAA domain